MENYLEINLTTFGFVMQFITKKAVNHSTLLAFVYLDTN